MFVRRRSLAVVAVAALTFNGLGVTASAAEQVEGPPAGRPDVSAPDPLARGLIVKTTTATPSGSLLAATDDALGAAAEVADDDVLTKKISAVGFDEVVEADVAADAAAEIEQRGDVEWAIPDTLLQPTAVSPYPVNDPRFPAQTNLWNTTGSAGGYSIKAPSLWRKTLGVPSVRVAVLDTGVTNHPELAGQLTADHDLDPGDWSAYGQCGPRSPASDSSWHGTFVAGMIAAKTNNGTDVAGIAPGVKVRPIRVLGPCGGSTQDVVDGMERATTGPEAAKVVNLSLSMQAANRTQRDRYCEIYNAYAAEGRKRGALFVAAAGNDYGNANLAIPAACSQFISVGATSIRGFSASYSNIGSSVDLAAPGGDPWVEGGADRIMSLGNTGTTSPSQPRLSLQQGTSMAAPEVSAAAALLYSLGFSTPAEVQRALYASVSPFRAKSKSYAKKLVEVDGVNYRFDLNCRGSSWCGRGLLDLSRVEAPLTTPPAIQGPVIIGEPLTASIGTWVRKPASPRYSWTRGGTVVGTSSTYYPTKDDVGQSIKVTVSPSSSAFAKLASLPSAAVTVPAGPAVTMTPPRRSITYGTGITTTVTVPGVADGGTVQLRTGRTVLASGVTESGVAELKIAKLPPGSHRLRAAYLGDGTTAAASSGGYPVNVAKLRAKVSRSVKSRVRTTSRVTLRVRVNETPNLFAGPNGKLRVYDGSRRIVTVSLNAPDRGRKSIRLPRLTKGKHRIKVVYSGNSYIYEKSSSRKNIRAY